MKAEPQFNTQQRKYMYICRIILLPAVPLFAPQMSLLRLKSVPLSCLASLLCILHEDFALRRRCSKVWQVLG